MHIQLKPVTLLALILFVVSACGGGAAPATPSSVPANTLPAPTALPTNTPPPPTATTTSTPVPPTQTPQPTSTATATPTATSTPTATPVPPTDTPAPTDTPVPPTETPRPRPTSTPALTGRILFKSNRNGNTDLYSMNANGSDVKQLTTVGDLDQARYSPEGQSIIVERNFDIYRMNADGSNVKGVFVGDNKIRAFPAWSPDGKQITYMFGWALGFEIYRSGADGSDPKVITARNGDWMPAWSPDGSTIVFSSARTGRFQLWTVKPDGTDLKQFTFDDFQDYEPVWSPDGRQIAFSQFRNAPQNHWQVMVVNADGSNPRAVIESLGDPDPKIYTTVVAWRGSRLLLSAHKGTYDGYVVNANGSGLTQITNGPKENFMLDWYIP